MVAECFAIIIIVLAICLIYLRAGRAAYAIAVIPLAFVPAVHLLAQALSKQAQKLLPLTALEIHIAADLLAALIACLCFGIFSTRFTDKGNRRAYLITCAAFTIIFTGVLFKSLGLF